MFKFLHNYTVYIILLLQIFKVHSEFKEKDLTSQMKNGLKAWCVTDRGSYKGNNAWEATMQCCKKELGLCFEPFDPKNKQISSYCLVKSNSKENAEKVKECCVSKRSKYKRHTGHDGTSIPLNGTNKYKDCDPRLERFGPF